MRAYAAERAGRTGGRVGQFPGVNTFGDAPTHSPDCLEDVVDKCRHIALIGLNTRRRPRMALLTCMICPGGRLLGASSCRPEGRSLTDLGTGVYDRFLPL